MFKGSTDRLCSSHFVIYYPLCLHELLLKAKTRLAGFIPLLFPLTRPEGCQLWVLCYRINSQTSFLNWTLDLQTVYGSVSWGWRLAACCLYLGGCCWNTGWFPAVCQRSRESIDRFPKTAAYTSPLIAEGKRQWLRVQPLLMGSWSGSPKQDTRTCLPKDLALKASPAERSASHLPFFWVKKITLLKSKSYNFRVCMHKTFLAVTYWAVCQMPGPGRIKVEKKINLL